jgi:hypothetical protein
MNVRLGQGFTLLQLLIIKSCCITILSYVKIFVQLQLSLEAYFRLISLHLNKQTATTSASSIIYVLFMNYVKVARHVSALFRLVTNGVQNIILDNINLTFMNPCIVI